MAHKYRKLRRSAGGVQPAYIPPPAPLAVAVIRRITRQNALDPRLLPTDRHMQRWARGQGAGLPNEDRALFPISNLTPLPEIEAIVTDQIVLGSPGYWRRFIGLWYRSDCSVDQLCTRLSMGRDKVFVERRIVLAYMFGSLTNAGIHIASLEPGFDGE